jgi:hypothetical protein
MHKTSMSSATITQRFMTLFPPVLGSLMDFCHETFTILFLSSARI